MQAVKKFFPQQIGINENEDNRNFWLRSVLAKVPNGLRILDAGAGQLRNKPLCQHLIYVSQDVCQYEGHGDSQGLQTGVWDTSGIDLVCDIVDIPEPDASYDVILCSEVFEHLPDPLKALDEFKRLLKPGGKLILTAPFASFVHFAPYHFATGFSKYWYEYHLPPRDFDIEELSSNGDWFSYVRQEMFRMPTMARKYGAWHWPFAYLIGALGAFYLSFNDRNHKSDELASFGWHCVAIKR
jgi:SAM-dependent methyltransferase